MKSLLVNALLLVAGVAGAYRCPGAVCSQDDAYLSSGDCGTYGETTVSEKKPKIKYTKKRDVIFNEYFDNCSNPGKGTASVSTTVDRDTAVKVTYNMEGGLDVANKLALGIKGAVDYEGTLTTHSSQSQGYEISGSKKKTYQVTVSADINPYSSLHVSKSVYAKIASGPGYKRRIAVSWTEHKLFGNTDWTGNCFVTADGNGNGSSGTPVTTLSQHKCVCTVTTAPGGGSDS